MSGRGILLDRDGTLNPRPAPHHYLTTAEGFAWLPDVPEALASLSHAGYLLGVASNQRGVARGLVHPNALAAIEHRIQEDLKPLGAAVGAFRYCLHDIDANCICRKPKPGLLHLLAEDLDIDLKQSWMVGDTGTDVAAGLAAGCRTAVVGTETVWPEPELYVASLLEFARRLAATRERR